MSTNHNSLGSGRQETLCGSSLELYVSDIPTKYNISWVGTLGGTRTMIYVLCPAHKVLSSQPDGIRCTYM